MNNPIPTEKYLNLPHTDPQSPGFYPVVLRGDFEFLRAKDTSQIYYQDSSGNLGYIQFDREVGYNTADMKPECCGICPPTKILYWKFANPNDELKIPPNSTVISKEQALHIIATQKPK